MAVTPPMRPGECARNCSVSDYLLTHHHRHHLFLSYILGAVETIGTLKDDESYTFNTLIAMGIMVVLTVTVGVGVK